jgi:hypothetical protein
MDDVWAHAVNSRAALAAALADPAVTMLEADVIVGLDVAGTLLMGHPPATTSDLSLQVLLCDLAAHNTACSRAGQAGKGLKLDFKDPLAVDPALEMLRRCPLGVRIWLNADVLPGPFGTPPRFCAPEFVACCLAKGPSDAVLSLGWTVGAPTWPWQLGYTAGHVASMLQLCAAHGLTRVTFAMQVSADQGGGECLCRLFCFGGMG